MSRTIAALRLIGVGFFIGVSIVLGVVAGLWLDNRFDTGPVLAIIGLLLGIAVAFYGVFQMLLPLIGYQRNKDRN
ncbi:MAG: AtpZ/AtpI family protein [Dehalococcoidales bacterium]